MSDVTLLHSGDLSAFDLKSNPALFDATWRSRCVLRPCQIKEAKGFLMRHYLHRLPAVTPLCLKVLCGSIPIGVITFSVPPRETLVRFNALCWELSRLYLMDSVPTNAESFVISKAVQYVKRHHRHVQMLVSYADPAAGHLGTIYKAANWTQDGMTDEGRKTPRVDYYDSTGKKGRSSHCVGAVLKVPRKPKLRFIIKLWK